MSSYITHLKQNLTIKNFFMLFLIVYLPIFSFGIFAPTEIFFANYVDLGVIFKEFGFKFLGYGTLFAVLFTIICLFLPKLFQKITLSILWIFSLCGYIQTMFLNGNADLVGATTDGYIPDNTVVIKNFIIWAIIIIIALIILIKSKENWKKPLFLTSLVLFSTQCIAYSTLFLSAPVEAMEYVESEYYLSGEKQYTVSSEENVIVFILDTISNIHYESFINAYPEAYSYLADFTYYYNNDCNYYGTFPSIVHILTGHDVNPSIPINDWVYECWNNEATTKYYNDLHSAGYNVNVFAVEPWLFTGSHDLSLVKGRIDNLTSQSQERKVNHSALYDTLLKISCYRFMPDYFKPYFDVPNTQYATLVTYPGNVINYMNPDFYSDLIGKGLSVNNDEKYLTFYHLNGVHELINDENCQRVDDAGSFVITMKGIWEMLAEYLNQLKDLDIYDNSTIIITSDHGAEAHPQSIFFIKHADEHHDTMQVTNAPISLDELAPTIAQIVTKENEYLGKTIYDFNEGEYRERTLYIRGTDPNYPAVKKYNGDADSHSNIYKLFTYTGDYYSFWHLYENDIYTIIPMTDSYF